MLGIESRSSRRAFRALNYWIILQDATDLHSVMNTGNLPMHDSPTLPLHLAVDQKPSDKAVTVPTPQTTDLSC